jgi:hypothetical protein
MSEQIVRGSHSAVAEDSSNCLCVQEKEDGEKNREGEDENGNMDGEKAGGTQNSKERDSLKKGSGGSTGVGPPTGSSSIKKKKKKKKNDHSSGSGNLGSAKKGGKKDESHGKDRCLSWNFSDQLHGA